MSEGSSKFPRASLFRTLGTLLAIALLGYLLHQQGLDEIWESVQLISIGRFLLVLGLTSVSRLAVTSRWTSLLLLSGIRIPLRRILGINYAGLFASNFLPTSVGGDVVLMGDDDYGVSLSVKLFQYFHDLFSGVGI